MVLQWGFNQAVFLVVTMATARPDLSLVPVKRERDGNHTSNSTEPGSKSYASYSPAKTP